MANPVGAIPSYLTSFLSAAQSTAPTQLIGTNGVNGGKPVDSEPTTNYPFDQRWLRAGLGGTSSEGAFTAGVVVTGGYMTTASSVTTTSGTPINFTAHFQFNPTEIDLDYGFDSSVIGALNPQFQGSTNADAQGLILNQTVSFSLLFDRTYEVWTGPSQISSAVAGDNGGPYTFGAMWDVWAIERLCGIYGQAAGNGPSGPPAATLLNVSFGNFNTTSKSGFRQRGGRTYGSGKTSAYVGGRAMAFSGWMTSLQVAYTRFDASMVPTRAAVDVSFEQVYSLQSFNTGNTPNDAITAAQAAAAASATSAKGLAVATRHSATGANG